MDFSNTPDYWGNVLLGVNTTMIVLSIIIFGTRIYARTVMTKNLGLDDALAAVAFV
jgi:hypothetical protein